ncbi:hypothetical protein C4D60_Mb04t18040 [Musa balbisiana]|uniref:Chalcone-flavonone isomerase family protein n=1 Tax=Musa balbisiana TaxID=52838 RepID=A0A4S8KD02_MUSBA|nr:hypothetical protein C4D60_Mb04t18040 [Musa balbisiana]
MSGGTGSPLPKLEVEGVVFPPMVTPPGSTKAHFLGGAGVRGLEIEGRILAFFLKSMEAGPFEKFTRVTLLKPLTGQQYAEKVSENCAAQWKAAGVYTEADGAALEQFKEAFRAETFPPGSSILFTHAPSDSLLIAFSKDGSMPEAGSAMIQNQPLSQAILESIIGEHGVSPGAKRSLALRFSELLKQHCEAEETKLVNHVAVIV